jgi:hypothetical protein
MNVVVHREDTVNSTTTSFYWQLKSSLILNPAVSHNPESVLTFLSSYCLKASPFKIVFPFLVFPA